jgi:riboflavin synthase
MFTGIVEEAGRIERIFAGEKSIRLAIHASVAAQEAKIGDSIAVNGCCLTIVNINGTGVDKILVFDLLKETWERTNLQFGEPGALVNLERSLSAEGRIHGHFVTGHVDGIGRVKALEKRGEDWFLSVEVPPELARYTAFKGSIAIDGISLTVADAQPNSLSVWLIPHTYEVTALPMRKAGDYVNLEVDLLAKYVEKFLPSMPALGIGGESAAPKS